MADVTLDLQNSNPKELYGKGVRAYVLQDYDTAVKAFSRTSELLVEQHGSETHDSLGDVYLYYGKSLLELSRRNGDPLGEGLPKNVEEESEEETEEVEEEEEEKKDGEEEKKDGEEEKKDGDAEKKSGEEEKKDGEEEEANGEEAKEQKEGEEEELTDLQVAWEVLELAKSIFTARGADAKKNLAETLIILGEISLENGNSPAAVEDMSEGLKIQKSLFGDDSRTVAETFYKLGGAYSTNGQIDEAIESFHSSLEYLKNKVTSLEKEHKEDNAEEIEELKGLIPEIEEKIADMKNLKTEITKKMTTTAEEAAKSNGASEGASSSSSSSSKQVNDISHLVKRKRKQEDAAGEENPAKKPSP